MNKSILIGEHDQTVAERLTAELVKKFPQFKFHSVHTGQELLHKALEISPGIIFLDHDIPGVNATEIIDLLIKDEVSKNIPVILNSKRTDELKQLGQKEYENVSVISRPFKVMAVINLIDKLILANEQDANVKRLSFGEMLCRQGEAATEFYFVRKGRLRVFVETDGGEVELGEVGRNEFLGEIAFINEENRSANVEALCECELVVIPASNLEQAVLNSPKWSNLLIRTLAHRLANLTTQVTGKTMMMK